MANIHQTIKQVRDLYAVLIQLHESILASHQELKNRTARVEAWNQSAAELMAQIEKLRVPSNPWVFFAILAVAGFAGAAATRFLEWLF